MSNEQTSTAPNTASHTGHQGAGAKTAPDLQTEHAEAHMITQAPPARPASSGPEPLSILSALGGLMLTFVVLIALISSAAHAAPLQNQTVTSFDGADVVATEASQLLIEQNKGTLIRLSRPAREVFIANPAIADVQVKSPRLVYIFGRARGETTFYALDENDQSIFNAEVRVTQNLGLLQAAINRMLPEQPIEVAALGNMILLTGRVDSPEQAETAERLAEALGGAEEILNRVAIMQPTQVNLRVRFAEVSRTVLKELGINFESAFTTGNFLFGFAQGRDVISAITDPVTGEAARQFTRQAAGATSLAGSLTNGSVDLNGAIDALDDEGFITVLAEPNLTALTGETANFLAGGEFPVPIPSRDGLGIEFREFGVSLDFTPTVLSSGRISMRIRPEVSDLSEAGAIRVGDINVPSVVTRRAETTVELGSGQSFAIAGLLQNDVTQSAQKLPGLGDIPILGALFRSEQFRREETELVIVVTPYVVRPVSDRQLALPTDGFVAPSDMQRFLKGRRFVPTKGQAQDGNDSKKGASIKARAGFRLD